MVWTSLRAKCSNLLWLEYLITIVWRGICWMPGKTTNTTNLKCKKEFLRIFIVLYKGLCQSSVDCMWYARTDGIWKQEKCNYLLSILLFFQFRHCSKSLNCRWNYESWAVTAEIDTAVLMIISIINIISKFAIKLYKLYEYKNICFCGYIGILKDILYSFQHWRLLSCSINRIPYQWFLTKSFTSHNLTWSYLLKCNFFFS